MIDAHHHLWDLSVREQPWLTGGQPWATEEELRPLRRSFTVADLESVARPEGVTGTVVVQVLSDPAETADLLAIAGADNIVRAVVGWADLTRPDVADQITAYQELPGGDRLAGIRHPMLAEPDPDWLARPAVREGLRQLAAAGLCFDLTVFARQLPLSVATARSVPECVFVLDHLGNPPAESADGGGRAATADQSADGGGRAATADQSTDDQGWATAIADLGRCGNVVCKLSGAHTTPASAALLRPYFEAALAAFGPDRLMFGSDWPVSGLTAPYSEISGMYRGLIADLPESEQHAILDGTARRVYRIEPG